MNLDLATLIFATGFGQLSVLVASALVPLRLNWREEFAPLKRLHRQMYWTYGGYVVLSIIALGLICLFNSRELASGNGLARSFCLYGAAFWGIRLCLQPVFDVKEHLTTWWLRAGYYFALSLFFAVFTLVYTWGSASAAAVGHTTGTIGTPISLTCFGPHDSAELAAGIVLHFRGVAKRALLAAAMTLPAATFLPVARPRQALPLDGRKLSAAGK